MKTLRALALAIPLLLLSAVSGCAAWFEQLRTNPIAGMQTGVSYLQAALGLAKGAFDVWASTTNDPNVDQTRQRFNDVTSEVNRGIILAQDGLTIAAHASAPAPDSEQLLKDARGAMGNLNSFLTGLSGSGPGHAASPLMHEAIAATASAAKSPAY